GTRASKKGTRLLTLGTRAGSFPTVGRAQSRAVGDFLPTSHHGAGTSADAKTTKMSEPSLKKPEPPDESRMVVMMSIREFRRLIAEEVRAALQYEGVPVVDKDDGALLTPEQTAERMGVEVRWLYRHSKQLPFTRKLSRKVLQFSEAGLRKWLTARNR